MKYPDASQMRYPDASKAWDPKARRVLEARPAQSRAAAPSAAPSAAPAGRASIAAAAIFAPAAAAQSGNLPPPAAAAAAAGNSPLQVPQAAMAIGEPIPVIWGRRRGNVGGVLVFPRATEARFENTSSTASSRYHMVIGEGRIPDIQRRDVRCGECRIGTFSQNESARAGSWAPGNFATAASFSWTPTNFTGGGGNYQGLATFEAGATFAGGSDDWRTAWNVFLRGGTIVERGRLLDSTVDSSDNIADLVLWALQRSGRVPDGMIDFPSLQRRVQQLDQPGGLAGWNPASVPAARDQGRRAVWASAAGAHEQRRHDHDHGDHPALGADRGGDQARHLSD